MMELFLGLIMLAFGGGVLVIGMAIILFALDIIFNITGR